MTDILWLLASWALVGLVAAILFGLVARYGRGPSYTYPPTNDRGAWMILGARRDRQTARNRLS